MSANLYWQPVKGKDLNVGAPSSFMAALERAVGAQPWHLNEGHVHILKGLAAGLDSTDQREAVETLIAGISRHSEVRVWPEY